MKTLYLVLIVLLMLAPARAIRPLSTDDAATLGGGAWEIESGYEIDQPKGGGSGAAGIVTSIKYGVLPNLDLGIEFSFQTNSPGGVGDASVKGKLGISGSFALGMDVKLANGDAGSGLGSGHADFGLNAIYSLDAGAANLHLNLGYTLVGAPGGSDPDASPLFLGAALFYPYADYVNIMAEVAGYLLPDAAANAIDLLFGFNWEINEILTLDGGAGFGLTEAASEYKTTLGATLVL